MYFLFSFHERVACERVAPILAVPTCRHRITIRGGGASAADHILLSSLYKYYILLYRFSVSSHERVEKYKRASLETRKKNAIKLQKKKV